MFSDVTAASLVSGKVFSDTLLTHFFAYRIREPCPPIGRGGWSDVELAHLVQAWIYVSNKAITGIYQSVQKFPYSYVRMENSGLLAASLQNVNSPLSISTAVTRSERSRGILKRRSNFISL